MKRALVTGATGFVGANLARRLLAEGHEVHLLLRPEHDPWRIEEVRDDLRLHEAVLDDIESVCSLVETVRPDWLFHLAAYGAYPSQDDLAEMVRTNVVGTMNLLEASRQAGFEAFVNTGSSSEYGFKDHPPSEDEALEPNSHYAVTKAAGTMFCRHTAQAHDLHVSTLRLYSVYGPYEEPTRLLPTLIVRGLAGELPRLASPGIARDYVYTEDVCDAYMMVAERTDVERGVIYNVGTGVQTTLQQIVDLARRTFRIRAEPEWASLPERSWDTEVWVSDPSRIRAEHNWEPRYDLAQGFSAMIDWLRSDGERRARYEKHSQ